MTDTSPEKPGSATEPQSDREDAETLYGFVTSVVEDLDSNATGAELVARTRSERLADAQLLALQAIYHELRHGHDQAARQTAAIEEHTKALDEHADAMDKLRGAMLDHSDTISRYRGREH